MSYYLNRIDEKFVKRRTTSKSAKEIAALKQELVNKQVQASTLKDQKRRKFRDATSPVPKEKAYIHFSDKSDLSKKGSRKLKSGEPQPRNVSQETRMSKTDATARGANTQQATGSGNKAKRRMKDMGITEAIYNSFVDIAYVICEMQTRQGKGRLLRPGEKPSRGKVFRSKEGERTTVTEKPTHLTGAYGDNDKDPGRVRARIQQNIAMQNPQEPREGTVASKKAKRYKRLHQRANAGDKKAMELLRRAEMSGND